MRARRASHAFTVAAVFLLVVTALSLAGMLPRAVPWIYLGMSLLAFAVYAWDKSAARKGEPRTPENTLHLLALCGGWPGALCAQQHLRHKTVKQPFRALFLCTVAINVAALGYLLTDSGQRVLATVSRVAG